MSKLPVDLISYLPVCEGVNVTVAYLSAFTTVTSCVSALLNVTLEESAPVSGPAITNTTLPTAGEVAEKKTFFPLLQIMPCASLISLSIFVV